MLLLIRPCKAELRGFMSYDEVSQNLIFRLSYQSWIRMMIELKTFAYPVNVYILISVVRHINSFSFSSYSGYKFAQHKLLPTIGIESKKYFKPFLGDPP